jgi:tetratricopeptide (TPR) repeat protein
MTSRLRRSIAFGILTAALSVLAAADEPREGLVVLEAPTPGTGSAAAGLLPGDVLLSWRRGGASGVLRWPSGLVEAEIEQAARGTVTLHGRRGPTQMIWRTPEGSWNLRTRPALSPHLLALYREGAEWFANRQPEKGAESWRAAVDAADRAADKPRAAWFLGELGRAWAKLGQWEEADAAYEEAIRRMERSGMGASLLREWGATFVRRELWARAESCYRRAFAQAPQESYTAARDLAMLATIATWQGDLDSAERRYRQALSTRKQIAPIGPPLVQVIREEVESFRIPPRGNSRGNTQEIDALRRRLERLRETLLAEAGVAPARPGESSARSAATAPPKKENPLELIQKALAKAEREAPGSLAVSDRWQELGSFAFENGDPVAAEIAWLRALDLREKLASGTLRDARTLHDLGRVHQKAERETAAASFFCRAAAALDRQGQMPVDDEAARAALGAEPGSYDRDCVAALVAMNRPEEAFLALERSRVRGTALPLAPQLARRRKDIDTERNRALGRLGRLSTSRDRDEVDLLLAYARDLEAQREEIAGPLDLDGIRAALPAGTVLLAWSIGETESFLFVVQPAGTPGLGVEVHPVRSGAAALWERVDAFAAEAGTVETGPGPTRKEAVELYRLLLGPVDTRIATAEKLLVLPDDILAPLPFDALVRGEDLLGKQKPIETDASATAWAARAARLRTSLPAALP